MHTCCWPSEGDHSMLDKSLNKITSGSGLGGISKLILVTKRYDDVKGGGR